MLTGLNGWFNSSNSTSYDYAINRITQQITLATKKGSQWNLYTTIYGGYFITDRFMVGLSTQGNYSSQEYFLIGSNNRQLPTVGSKFYTIQMGPKVRYYVINKKAGVFLDGQYTLGRQADIDGYGISRVRNGRIQSTSLGGGVYYFIHDRWALEGIISTVFERKQADIELLPDAYSTYKVVENSNQLNVRLGVTYSIKR